MGGDATHSFSVVNFFFILWTILIHSKTIPNYAFFQVNFSFSAYTQSSCACALVVFHSISLIIIHQNILHHADGGVGNSSPSSYTPSSACVTSSHSSSFIHTHHHTDSGVTLLVFFLHTTLCMYDFISFITIFSSWVPSYVQNYQHQTLGVFHVTNYYIIISF